MQLGRTAALIARLKEHLEKTETSQVALSKELGLSPQNTSLILRGTNCPNSETTLQIALEILRTNQMNNEPKTLLLAKERISELTEEIKLLKGMAARATPPAAQAPTLPAKPARPTGSTSIAELGRNPMIIRPETPVTALDHLRVELNQASTEEEKNICYRRIKALEAEQSGPRPRARLRGV
jgi:hypothetical protein